MLAKQVKRKFRHNRVKSRIDSSKPRLVVHRSLRYVQAQIVDDIKGKTLVSASDVPAKGKFAAAKTKETKTQRAAQVGKDIASKAIKLKIETVVFDRAGYKYHGRVKSLADGAREGGLRF